jgi:hypothetical protein
MSVVYETVHAAKVANVSWSWLMPDECRVQQQAPPLVAAEEAEEGWRQCSDVRVGQAVIPGIDDFVGRSVDVVDHGPRHVSARQYLDS